MFEGPNDVRIKMKASRICGSDVHHLKMNMVPVRGVDIVYPALVIVNITLHP
ncbi:hypothetical protein MTR_4g115480 [Medicago truncatula]|uniref:Uncharacterized protein n=1 Tax=Medicago truncatula TaxID=3880 RepID=G7JFD9_MEDTR|nr:hypothetical protein MTR_4g115480 [Medicago truncatula]